MADSSPKKKRASPKKRVTLSSSTRKPKTKEQPPPPVAGAFERKPIKPTQFRKFYSRGDLPCCIEHRGGAGMNKVKWKVDIHQLDYHRCTFALSLYNLSRHNIFNKKKTEKGFHNLSNSTFFLHFTRENS